MAAMERAKSVKYFKRIFKYAYWSGWPNFGHSELDVSTIFKRCHSTVSKLMGASILFLVVTEFAGFFTQHELSEKQKTDRQLLGFSHPFLASYGYFLTYYLKDVRDFTYVLTVELKEHYNDEEIEVAMVKKARWYSLAYCIVCSSALVFYGMDGIKDGAFVTVITAWPDVRDTSTSAIWFRILAYIIWWIFMIRLNTTFVVVVSTLVCLGHQFKNLQSYFYSLDAIFQDVNLTQKEKEEKYEKGMKLGIKMHARTLWCTRQCEACFMGVVSGQILVNVAVIILLMVQMVSSERTFASVATTLSTMSAMLTSTGCFMWNAGDITVEAAVVSTAMYSSGWHHCVGAAAVRVRRLLVIAMAQAQVPVYIRTLGIVTMSYASYVSIVKSSYSVFSVLY